MRKKEKEIKELADIEAVIKKAHVCRLGMCNDNIPYIVPVCFGYQDQKVYIHSSLKGQKIEFLKKNPNVCVEFEIDTEIVENEQACKWGVKFKSVIGFGKASFIADKPKRIEALEIIMQQYADRSFSFDEKALDVTAVILVEIGSMTGKQS